MEKEKNKMSPAERVAFYEEIFFFFFSACHREEGLTDEQRRKLKLLEEYYTSGDWRTDYEADEAGELPADLKRGVLSQDGVYDLLADYEV